MNSERLKAKGHLAGRATSGHVDRVDVIVHMKDGDGGPARMRGAAELAVACSRQITLRDWRFSVLTSGLHSI